MSLRVRLGILLAAAVVAFASTGAVWAASAARSHRVAKAANTHAVANQESQWNVVAGKRDYRTYCGQCHALTAALAAGFGGENKFGQDGGPSFNDLRVSAALCIAAITELFSGHEIVLKQMTWTQIHDVSAFVQQATRKNPIVAKMTDG